MVKVKVVEQQGIIQSINITGHAYSNEPGKDLVCAEISAISVGAMNAIENMCPNSCEMQMKEGLVDIKVLTSSEMLQVILNTIKYQLRTVEHSNKKYIKIKES